MGKCVIAALIVAPICLLAILSPDQIPNPYWLMLVGGLVPWTGASYLVFGVVDQACLKANLYEKEDQLTVYGNDERDQLVNGSGSI